MVDKEKKDKSVSGLELDEANENRRAGGPGLMKIFLFVALPLMLLQAGLAYFLINRYLIRPTEVAVNGTTVDGSVAADAAWQGRARLPRNSTVPRSVVADTSSGYSLLTRANHKLVSGDEEDVFTGDERDNGKRYSYFVKDIIVNPAATAGTRFLNVTLVFEYSKSDLQAELQEQDFRIRDALIGIFISKRIDEVDGPDDKERLRQEILFAVNRLLTKGKVKKVYFTNFVMQ